MSSSAMIDELVFGPIGLLKQGASVTRGPIELHLPAPLHPREIMCVVLYVRGREVDRWPANQDRPEFVSHVAALEWWLDSEVAA